MARFSFSTLSTDEALATNELITGLLRSLYSITNSEQQCFPADIGEIGLFAGEIRNRGRQKSIVFHLFSNPEKMKTMFVEILNSSDLSNYRSVVKQIQDDEEEFRLEVLRDEGTDCRAQVEMIVEQIRHYLIVGSQNRYDIIEDGSEAYEKLEFFTYLIALKK